ncbi:MAG: CusA/CzcA family heavy metal efflux RND transporter [Saprospiraceae bacterium]
MFDRIIYYSIHNKLIVLILLLFLIISGLYSLRELPIDAVPDITDNQVQVITSSSDLSAQEVERFVTFPLEMEMGNIPDVKEIRSISRFGLSVITIVFLENVDIYWAREQINQKIQKAKKEIPEGMGNPEMGPITTGLGEIYQYVIYPDSGYEDQYSATDLRTIQDWIIKRQIIGIPGVVEVNSLGGYLKQYEISVDQNRLKSFNLDMGDIFTAIADNNANAGGSYIEKANQTFFIRGEGMAETVSDLENILVRHFSGGAVLIKHVADVTIGHAPRFGAVTMNGKGEVVAGQVLMLKGANSNQVTEAVKKRIEEIKPSLPKGIILEPYLDRSKLVRNTTNTVIKNLLEGALIVVFILVLMLGNFRAGLIVASVIPLALLFAVCMMRIFGVSANLMSLGALDFGLIVDGAVIIVEAIMYHLGLRNEGSNLNAVEKEKEVFTAASKIRTSAAFGEIIILIVYLPILFLQGIEGKMFIPMAQTVAFAILGALLLSLTYVPMMSAVFLKDVTINKNNFSSRLIDVFYSWYAPVRDLAFRFKRLVLLLALALFGFSLFMMTRMGGEFIPTLEEGDFALHQILPSGSSLKKGVEVSAHLQDILMSEFPEVDKVVTKIGTAEIPTDIMPLEAGDIFVIMKPKSEWTSAKTKEEMFEKMEKALNQFPGVMYEFTQPIQMRFNELMTGIRQDIAIKIYGEDLGILSEKANEAEKLLNTINGVGDIQVEATTGLRQIVVDYDRLKMNKYGVSVSLLNETLKTAFAGKIASQFYEGEKKFDIVVRLQSENRKGIESIRELQVSLPHGGFVPISEVAEINFEEGPAQISRDDTKRRITIGVNARNTDIATLIADIKSKFESDLSLPVGYYIRYGGQFENLERARSRLMLVVPLALALIFLLLFFTFGKVKYALLIFVAIPLSAIGGIWALYFRGMAFSISAGVGFIALFGVAVLNGIVLIAYFNQLKDEGMTDIMQIIKKGTRVRLRPVLLTASVASLGFLPMALSTSAGAEVQRPLATVVIGGLITATILTLIILPVMYYMIEKSSNKISPKVIGIFLLFFFSFSIQAQNVTSLNSVLEDINMDEIQQWANLQKEALTALSKNPLPPNPWSFSVGGEEFNLKDVSGIHSLQVQRSFRMPGVVKSYRGLNEVSQQEIDNQVQKSVITLKKKITSAYVNVSYQQAIIGLQTSRKSVFIKLLHITNAKSKLGESSVLVNQQAALRLKILESEIQQNESLRNSLLQWITAWTEKDLTQVEDLSKIEMKLSDSDRFNHPSILSMKIQSKLLNQQQIIRENKVKAQPFMALSLQSVNNDLLFYGYKVGVNLPFAGAYKRSQKQAAELSINALAQKSNWIKKNIEIQLENVKVKTSQNKEMIVTIEGQIRSNQSLVNNFEKAFSYGEVDYADLILISENLFFLQKKRLGLYKDNLLIINNIIHNNQEF